MIQSQGLLSELSIPYSDCPTQADIDAKAQAVIAAYNAKKAGTYTTPAPATPPTGSWNFDISAISAHYSSLAAMQAAQKAGDVATAHADCDKANTVAPLAGWPWESCSMSDIDILCNAPGWTGRVAQAFVAGEYSVFANMDAAGQIIAAAVAQTPTPAPAGPAAISFMDLPGPLPGYILGQTVKFPDGSDWVYTNLPFGPPPLNATYRLVRQP